MTQSNLLTHCISTYNNLPYLKLAIQSVRKNSYYKDAPFIIHAENCNDGTDEWLFKNKDYYNLDVYIDHNNNPIGIGGGMNFCAQQVQTEYINFLHSDFYVTKDWDLELLKIHQSFPEEKLWVNSYRIEPNIFNNSPSNHGTLLVHPKIFGSYYHDFSIQDFEYWVNDFKSNNTNLQIPKGHGVSGLVKKSLWNEIGGNDPIFAPTSWDDMDLFLRMLQYGVRFVLPFSSVVWHFGARGSHRLEENQGQSSQRQIESEYKNTIKWFNKWGVMPSFDEYGMIKNIN